MDEHFFVQPSTSEAHTPYYGTEMYPPTSSTYFGNGTFTPLEGQEQRGTVQNPYQHEQFQQAPNPGMPKPEPVLQTHSPASSGDLESGDASPQDGGPPMKKRRKPSKAAPTPEAAKVEENFDPSLDSATSPSAKLQDGEKPKKKRERQTANSIFCTFEDTTGNGVVCKQRAILAHRHCIRHILLDPEAPYQQCKHQRKPKNKKDLATQCTNAVRKDLGVDFCSTHMIMAGLKEAKKKPPILNAPASNEAPSTPEQHYSPGPVPLSTPVQQQQQQSAPMVPMSATVAHSGQMQPQQIIIIPQQQGGNQHMIQKEGQMMHAGQMSLRTEVLAHDGRQVQPQQAQHQQFYPNTYAQQHAQQTGQYSQHAQHPQTPGVPGIPGQQQQQQYYAQSQQEVHQQQQQHMMQHQRGPQQYHQHPQQQQVFISSLPASNVPPQQGQHQQHPMSHSALGRALASPDYHPHQAQLYQPHPTQNQQGSDISIEVSRPNDGFMEESHLMKALISPGYEYNDKTEAVFQHPAYPDPTGSEQHQRPSGPVPGQSGRPGMPAGPGPVARTSSAPLPVKQTGPIQTQAKSKARKASVPAPTPVQASPTAGSGTATEAKPLTTPETKPPPKKRSRAKKPPTATPTPSLDTPGAAVPAVDSESMPDNPDPNIPSNTITQETASQPGQEATPLTELPVTPPKIPSLPFPIKKGQQLTPEQCEQALSRIREDPATAAAFGKHRQLMAQRRAMAQARGTGKRRVTTRRALQVKHTFSDRLDRILCGFDRAKREQWMAYLASLAANQIRVKGRASFPALQQKMPHLAGYICRFGKTPLPRPIGARQAREQMLQILPSAAPAIRPPTPINSSSSSDEEDDEEQRANSKLIVLRQRGQPKKIVGPHRVIPQVDLMARLMEDADFDKTDLFPLGLEPSDDEESYPGNTMMPVCGFNALVKTEDVSLDLYLMKKQLRVEKYGLMKTAHLNAPLMNAAKHFPNSAGVALLQRNEQENILPPRMLTAPLRRCCKVEEKKRCERACLPMSNHCSSHVLFNVNQRLFSFCTQSLCRRPVASVDVFLWDGKCQLHRDTYENKFGEYPEYEDSDEEMDEEEYEGEEIEEVEQKVKQHSETLASSMGFNPMPTNPMTQQPMIMQSYSEQQNYNQLMNQPDQSSFVLPSQMMQSPYDAGYSQQTGQLANYGQYMGAPADDLQYSANPVPLLGSLAGSLPEIFQSNNQGGPA